MIILDTNVISEMMRATPDPRTFRWIEAQPIDELWTTVITEAEIRIGVSILPKGRRREAMAEDAEAIFQHDLQGRVLPFDRAAAAVIGPIYAERRRLGRSTSVADMQIAAIARVHGAAIATRDVGGFEASGVEIIDPWAT